MIRFRRTLGRAALCAALATPALALPVPAAGDAQEVFEEGVELWRRGRSEEALEAFQRVLALDPSSEEAYTMLQQAEHQVLLEILAEGGQYELVAKRIMELSRIARVERSRDEESVRELLREMTGDDVLASRRAEQTLASRHGEFAVPLMLGVMGEGGDTDRRVRFMTALTRMGDDVTLPLVAALAADDAALRRNVSIVLGRIGDERAAPALARTAGGDADEGVRRAASDALEAVGGGTALEGFLAQGAGYQAGDRALVRPWRFTPVAWDWTGGRLEARDVPAWLWGDAMALRSYHEALTVQPDSPEALAGVARVIAGASGTAFARERAGEDVEAVNEQLAEARLALAAAGPVSLNAALASALDDGDEVAALWLARSLQASTPVEPGALAVAIAHPTNAALRAEAAVALGQAAFRSGVPAAADVIAELAAASAREVMHSALVIDGDANRSAGLAASLEESRVAANVRETGGAGLSALYRLPGVDLILLADRLPDLTAIQVLDAIRANPTTAATPVLIVSSDAETADELYGARTSGSIASGAEVETALAALGEAEGRGSDLVDDLSRRATGTLLALASGGGDVSAAIDAVATNLEHRPDAVVIPSVAVLGRAGLPHNVGGLLGVLADGARSDEVRTASGRALAEILRRNPHAGQEAVTTLAEVAGSDAPRPVRMSAACALGQAQLQGGVRARLLEAVRVDLRAAQ
jgi:CheY-like chemotaxis protein/tetratricopeptide (TPR) repeat protein